MRTASKIIIILTILVAVLGITATAYDAVQTLPANSELVGKTYNFTAETATFNNKKNIIQYIQNFVATQALVDTTIDDYISYQISFNALDSTGTEKYWYWLIIGSEDTATTNYPNNRRVYIQYQYGYQNGSTIDVRSEYLLDSEFDNRLRDSIDIDYFTFNNLYSTITITGGEDYENGFLISFINNLFEASVRIKFDDDGNVITNIDNSTAQTDFQSYFNNINLANILPNTQTYSALLYCTNFVFGVSHINQCIQIVIYFGMGILAFKLLARITTSEKGGNK